MSEHINSTREQDESGFDRRSFIRRSAVVGAATVWAVPTVQSIVTPAFATGTPAGGCTACLTGGGRINGATLTTQAHGTETVFVTLGIGQLCCEGSGPITVEINAHRGGPPSNDLSWHFDRNLVITCSIEEPLASPSPASANCANVFTGTVQDASGNTLTFNFEDHGEPAHQVDVVSIDISGPQGTLVADGSLMGGNLQAHPSLGPIVRDCSGC